MKDIQRSPAAFNMDKLLWLNQYYLKTSDPARVASELLWQMEQFGIDTAKGPALVDVIAVQAERVKTLREMAEKSRYFYEPVVLDDAALAHLSADLLPALQAVQSAFQTVDWTREAIHGVIAAVAESHGLKMGKIAQPLRVIMTGGTVSPSIDVTIQLIGRDTAVERINNAIFLLTK